LLSPSGKRWSGIPGSSGAVLRLLAAASLLLLTGCGSAKKPVNVASPSRPEPQRAPEYTREQKLVEHGALLIVADGCSACHLPGRTTREAPSFLEFAGHQVDLASGRHVVINEDFLRAALLHPARDPIRGYNPLAMNEAAERLDFAHHPQQLAALIAFIEQVGPETE
jgi:hypothetical protein